MTIIRLATPSLATAGAAFLLVNLLMAAIAPMATTAMHYPRPVDEASRALTEAQWESVQDFRERMDIPFDYTPVALHPEDCRYKTETECQASDQVKLEYIQGVRRRAQADGEVADRPPRGPKQQHVLVLMMRFQDHGDRVLPTQAQHAALWENNIHKWLEKQSYGKHVPTFDVLDWMDTDNTEEYYSFGDYGREDDFEKSIHFLLNTLDADPEFDMSIYDTDGDGQVDNLVVLHSGYNSESFALDCQTERPPENGIWSHWRYTPDGWVSPTTGLNVNRYMVTSALDESCGSVPATKGIMVMNYMHSLGLESLYDQGTGIGNGLGKFDLMAYPYGNRNDGLPGSLSSFSKMKLEWITPIEVEENSYIQLQPWGREPEAVMISQKYSPGEYLLIENRQPVGVDDGFMGAGIAIFHVDEMQDGQAYASYPGKLDYPDDHYMIGVLPQDGNYDLEKGVNRGDIGDLWTAGTTLGPGMDDTVFPNTDGYQFGYVWENGLTISVVSSCGNPNRGQDMLIKIGGFGEAAPTGNPECVVVENDSAAVERPNRGTPAPEIPAPGPSLPTKEATQAPAPQPTDVPTAPPNFEGATQASTTSIGGGGVGGIQTQSPSNLLSSAQQTESPTEAPRIVAGSATTLPPLPDTASVTMLPTLGTSNIQQTESPTEAPHIVAGSATTLPPLPDAESVTMSPTLGTSNMQQTESPTEAPRIVAGSATTLPPLPDAESVTMLPTLGTSNIQQTANPTASETAREITTVSGAIEADIITAAPTESIGVEAASLTEEPLRVTEAATALLTSSPSTVATVAPISTQSKTSAPSVAPSGAPTQAPTKGIITDLETDIVDVATATDAEDEDEGNQGFDESGGTITVPDNIDEIGAGAILKLPSGESLNPPTTKAPELVDEIAGLDQPEPQSETRSRAGSVWRISYWTLFCGIFGWVLAGL